MAQDANATSFMFEGLKAPSSKYVLTRGVTDFGNLKQYNLFETGYPFLVLISAPKMLELLANENDGYKQLVNDYKHILEYEFRGIDGLDNITSETQELTNGINTLNVITKVTEQSAGTFTMRFFEKAGTTITKVHELFLRGIKDPRTQIKHYNGLISKGVEPGFEKEIFTFLYFVTDNTATKVERAYLIIAAQPTTAETNIFNSEKGEIGFKELSCEFNGFPITGRQVNLKAQEILDWMNDPSNSTNSRLISNSNNYDFTADPNATDSETGIGSVSKNISDKD